MESPTEQESSAGFANLTVVAFESRLARETATLIERYGGRPLIAPSMREVPLDENPAALEFGQKLLANQIDVAIFLTGVGVRALVRVLDGRLPRKDLTDALARITTVVRGPKPAAAMRELGLEPSISIPEPNTWREVLSSVSAAIQLKDRNIAVQEYGVSNHDLIAGLEARGARVMRVPVYRWALPEDRGPLFSALREIAQHHADVALFTSATQVTNVLQIADADGIVDAVRDGFRSMVIGSVGPVCTQALKSRGIHVDIEPEHPKLGHLVKTVASRASAILQRKREGEAGRLEVVSHPPARLSELPGHTAQFKDHPFIRACRLEAVPYTPIWLMRQAGRYMSEYRAVRERHSFVEMCERPELAAEVTVTAVRRLGVDAAIIFADILLPLLPMRVGLKYEHGDGPVIEHPLRTAEDLDRIPPVIVADALGFVADSIRMARRELAGKVPLIGFAGAPCTLASYLIEGGGSRQYRATKTFMYRQAREWHRLMEMLAGITAEYLNLQIDAGADVVQIFDSWVGSLGPDDYRLFVLPHMARLIAAIKPGVPVIHFGTITGNLLELMREAGGDIIGLDWRVNLGEAWERLGKGVGVQGNLDPIALFASVDEIRARAKAILDQAAGRPGHIFNLGHGILPETPVDHVIALVDAVHEFSAR